MRQKTTLNSVKLILILILMTDNDQKIEILHLSLNSFIINSYINAFFDVLLFNCVIMLLMYFLMLSIDVEINL